MANKNALNENDAPNANINPGAVKKETKLPTLQRNALCKLFDRHEFTPEEVLVLGYRRLQQAEGIGPKGLVVITAWLASHGHVLREPVMAKRDPASNRAQRGIETAVRLLRSHGFQVVRGRGD